MTLLADINEAAARRGVQMYGQTPRPIAPTRRTTPALNAGPLGPSRLQQMAAQARAAGPQEPEGGGGGAWYEQGLGVLLNNPVAKAAMVPLNLMAAPMRAIEYGYAESQRLLPEDLAKFSPISQERAAEANEQGFMESLLDPDYGFGQLAKQVGGDSEWAKWANRGIGLAGDVALDPTTYLTAGAGTGTRFAGQAGRASLAGRASRLGLADEIVQRAARLGPHGLSADELAKLGVRRSGLADIAPDAARTAADLGKEAPRQGVRFMGARIPGTEAITRPFTRTIAEARGAVNRAPGMSRVRRMRSPEGLEDAMEKLATGRDPRAGPMSATLAAELVDWNNTQRMASGSFKSTFVQRARPWVRSMKGTDPQEAVRLAEQGQGELARILEQVTEEADRYGVKVWHNVGGVGTKGYVPHVWTPDARRWFSKTDDFGKELRKEFGINIDDLNDESGVMLQRFFKARFDDAGKPIPYTVKGREVTILDDTIDGINKAFAEAFPEAPKILDDNATSIMSNYLGRMSQDVGVLAGAKRLLESKSGLVLPDDDQRVLREIADVDKTRTANEAAVREYRVLQQKLDDSAKKIRAEAISKVDQVRGTLTATMQQALRGIPTSSKLQKEITDLVAKGGAIEGRRARTIELFDEEIASFGQNLYDVEQKVRATEAQGLEAIEIAEQTKPGARGQMAKERAATRRRLLRELKANAEELQNDRDTLQAIRDRIAGMEGAAAPLQRKADILERGLEGPPRPYMVGDEGDVYNPREEFVAAYGGANVHMPRGPDQRPLVNQPPNPMAAERDALLAQREEVLRRTTSSNPEERIAARAELDQVNTRLEELKGQTTTIEPARVVLARDQKLADDYQAADQAIKAKDDEIYVIEKRLKLLRDPTGQRPKPPPEGWEAADAAVRAVTNDIQRIEAQLALWQSPESWAAEMDPAVLGGYIQEAEDLLMLAWERRSMLERERDDIAFGWRPTDTEVPPEVQGQIERATRDRNRLNREKAELYEKREAIARAQGLEPVYSSGGREMTERELELQVEKKYQAQEQRHLQLRDEPEPRRPEPVDEVQLRAEETKLAALEKRQGELTAVEQMFNPPNAEAGVPPPVREFDRLIETRSLATLRTRLRKVQAAIDQFNARRNAQRFPPTHVKDPAFLAAVEEKRILEAQIANIVEGAVPDPAQFRAEAQRVLKELDVATRERNVAAAEDARFQRAYIESMRARPFGVYEKPTMDYNSKTTKALAAAEKKYNKAKGEWDDLRKKMAPKRTEIADLPNQRKVVDALHNQRIERGKYPARKASHAMQVERAQRALPDLPRQLAAETKRVKRQGIVGYRRPGVARRSRPNQQEMDLLEMMAGDLNLPATERAAARTKLMELREKSPVFTGPNPKRIREIEERIAEGGFEEGEGQALLGELEFLRRPEEGAHIREPLMTPTDIAAAKQELRPAWKPPTAADDPIKVAMKTPQAQSGGSPELVTRHGRVSQDMTRARTATAELSGQGRAPTPDWDQTLTEIEDAMNRALVGYESFPAVGTAEVLEGALADSRRYADFTLRYTAAVQAGGPPGRDLSTHVLLEVMEDERLVVRADLADVRSGKGVIDYEVEKTVDLFRNLIEDVDNASNAQAWARKMTAISELEPGERIVHLRNRIAINETWQAWRKARLSRMRARWRYAVEHPDSVGKAKSSAVMESPKPHQEIIETYQREHSGVERILSPIRRERPKKRRYTYSREQFREARKRLKELEKEAAWSETRRKTRVEDIAALRIKLASGEVTITDALESKDPVVMNAKVEEVLMSVPGIGRVQARRIMEDSGVNLRYKKARKPGAPAGSEAALRTAAENKELVARYRREASTARRYARQAKAYEAYVENPTAFKRAVKEPTVPPARTVTAKEAQEAGQALQGVETTQFIGPLEPAKELPERFTTPGRLRVIKMSSLGKGQRERIALLVGEATGVPVTPPKPYRRSATVQRRFDVSEGRATNLAYDVEKLQNEISGSAKAIDDMKQELIRTEEGGLTSEQLALRNLLQVPPSTFDPVTGKVVQGKAAVIGDEGLEVMRRALGDDTAARVQTAWNAAITDDGQNYTSSMRAAYELLKEVYQADSEKVFDEMFNIAESPEKMKQAIQQGAVLAAQQNASAAIQNLEDSFRTLGLRFGEEEGGLFQILGYDRSRGTLNVEKLRATVTRRVNRDREVFKNAQQRRIANLTRRDLRLDTAIRSLGKKPTQTTVAMLRAGDKKAKEVLEGWMYTAGGNLRKYTEKDMAEGLLPEVIPDVQGRKVKGIKALVRDNPHGTIRRERVAHIKKMTPPTEPIREGGMVVPRADWEQVIGHAARQKPLPVSKMLDVRGRWVRPAPDPDVYTPGQLAVAGGRPTGALFQGSPAAQHRALTQAERAFEGAEATARGRLGSIQDELARIAGERAPLEQALPGAEAAVWSRKVEGDRLRAELEQASGSVTRPIDEYQARIQSQLDEDRAYTIRAIEQFGDWKDARTDATSRRLALVDHQLALTREAITHAETRKVLLDSNRAQLQADLKVIGGKAPDKAVELNKYMNEVNAIAAERMNPVPEMQQVGGMSEAGELEYKMVSDLDMAETLMQEAADKMGVLFMHDLAAPQVARVIESAEAGTFLAVTTHVLDDHWRLLAENLIPPGQPGIAARRELKSAMVNISEKTKTGELAKMIEFYTDFFKTYAVMSPGFQIRNAISGAFMNATEGVGLRYTTEAGAIWREWRKDPIEFAQTHRIGTPEATRIGQAMEATLGSGAGGQFAERGVGPTITRSSLIFNNPLTRASKWGGEWVEGPIRLALGLHTIDSGASKLDALNRITRIHFDYSQVSKMDRQAKRLIPFWTFMSRNLPLQVTQMYMKPKVYLWYQSMVRNLSEPNHPYTPGYWLEQGGFTMGGEIGGDPLYLAPDLPHTRVQQDIANLADPARLLSNINPLGRVPLETAIAGRKLYTGQQFSDTPEDIDLKMAPFVPLLGLLGQLQKGPEGQMQAKERGAYAMRSLFPPLQQLSRLFPNEADEFNKERQAQTMLRYIGIPAYQLTEGAKASEKRRQEFAS